MDSSYLDPRWRSLSGVTPNKQALTTQLNTRSAHHLQPRLTLRLRRPPPSLAQENIRSFALSELVDLTRYNALSRLLSLPAEIRNRIYRYTILPPPSHMRLLDVLHGLAPEPGLLTTCRQIRLETKIIYYVESPFHFITRDCDITPYMPYITQVVKCVRLSGSKSRTLESTCYSTTGQPNWTNPVKWVRLAHERKHFVWPCGTDRNTVFGSIIAKDPQVVVAAFRILRANLSRPWEDVLANLESLRCGVLISTRVGHSGNRLMLRAGWV